MIRQLSCPQSPTTHWYSNVSECIEDIGNISIRFQKMAVNHEEEKRVIFFETLPHEL